MIGITDTPTKDFYTRATSAFTGSLDAFARFKTFITSHHKEIKVTTTIGAFLAASSFGIYKGLQMINEGEKKADTERFVNCAEGMDPKPYCCTIVTNPTAIPPVNGNLTCTLLANKYDVYNCSSAKSYFECYAYHPNGTVFHYPTHAEKSTNNKLNDGKILLGFSITSLVINFLAGFMYFTSQPY